MNAPSHNEPISPARSKGRRRRPRRDREGAVMIVVMLVLLAGTATALFGVHSTTFEIRASGHARQALQAQYVAETGLVAAMVEVDQMRPEAFLYAMQRTEDDPTFDPNLDQYGEPPLLPGKHNYPFTTVDFTLDVLDNESIGGARQPYQPQIRVDVNDDHTYDAVLAGYRAGGGSGLRFLRATYTGRGVTAIPGQLPAGGPDIRPYHESLATARAYGLS